VALCFLVQVIDSALRRMFFGGGGLGFEMKLNLCLALKLISGDTKNNYHDRQIELAVAVKVRDCYRSFGICRPLSFWTVARGRELYTATNVSPTSCIANVHPVAQD
jgi:hypothetical protein